MMNTFFNTNKITVAVVTGQHPYDVPNFHAIFRSIPGIDFYPQHMEDFVFSGESERWESKLWKGAGEARKHYDVVLFYNFHRSLLQNAEHMWDKDLKPALNELGEIAQGIFILHHAILAFPKWKLWSEIVGIQDRRFKAHFNTKLRIEVANKEHPITKNLTSWEMIDESYTMHNAKEDSEILLTTDNPKSMTTIAWTRQYKKARVFCYQSGHDIYAYGDANFREVLTRGIQWLAGRIYKKRE